MWTVNHFPFRFGRNSNTTQTMARHLLCVVSYLLLASFNYRDQYSMGLFVLSCCTYNKTHPTWTSHASVSRIACPVEFGNEKTGGDMSSSFSKFVDLSPSSLKGLNVSG